MEMGAIIVPLREYERFAARSEFRGRAWSWVDPQGNDCGGSGAKNGILSLQDVAANYGKDVEELLAQIQRDKSLMEQFGVKYALEPYAGQILPVDGIYLVTAMATYKGVEIDTKPTASMMEEAERGLEWRKEFGRGGTKIGVARARDIKNGKELSTSTVTRMFPFFSRHEVDKKAEGQTLEKKAIHPLGV